MYLVLFGLSGLLLTCFQGIRITRGYSVSRIVVERGDNLARLACYTGNSIKTLGKLNKGKLGSSKNKSRSVRSGQVVEYLSVGRSVIQEPDVVARALQPTKLVPKSRTTVKDVQEFPSSILIRYKENASNEWFWPFKGLDAQALQASILNEGKYQVTYQTTDPRAGMVYAPFTGVVSVVRLRRNEQSTVCLRSMDGRVKVYFGLVGSVMVAEGSVIKKGVAFARWGRCGALHVISMAVERDGKARRPMKYLLSRCAQS